MTRRSDAVTIEFSRPRMPSGTGPNAFAYATGELRVADMVKAGFLLDLAGVPILVGVVFAAAAIMS